MSIRAPRQHPKSPRRLPLANGPAEDGWVAHSATAALISACVLLAPLGASVATAEVAGRLVPRWSGAIGLVEWWVVVLALSTAALVVVARVCRRLLPLAVLLRMTLIFPDQAPSRFAVARLAGSTRELARQVEQEVQRGADRTLLPGTEILLLASVISKHDRWTRGHSERVRTFTDMIAEELGLSPSDRERLRWSALLHDVGKITVHPDILNKDGVPNEAEWEKLRRHPLEGSRLIEPLKTWLSDWALTVEQHHERYDGAGYPFGLAGDEICLGARIVAVADSFEVMTAVRSYKKKPMGLVRARQELTLCAGGQFDPTIVRAFLNISLPQLRWVLGPVSWLIDVPVVGKLVAQGRLATLARSVPAGTHAAAALGTIAITAAAVLPIAQHSTPNRPAIAAASVRKHPGAADPRPALSSKALAGSSRGSSGQRSSSGGTEQQPTQEGALHQAEPPRGKAGALSPGRPLPKPGKGPESGKGLAKTATKALHKPQPHKEPHHPKAAVHSNKSGHGKRIWQFRELRENHPRWSDSALRPKTRRG